jgi:glutaredoxin
MAIGKIAEKLGVSPDKQSDLLAHLPETGEVPAARGEEKEVTEEGNFFHKEGDFWTISYEGKLIRLVDAKGLHYIACLLRNPNKDIKVDEKEVENMAVKVYSTPVCPYCVMAKQYKCRLIAVYVVDTATLKELLLSRIFVEDESFEYEKSLLANGERYLNYIEELADRKGVGVEKVLRRGSIFASFLKLLPVFIFIIPGMIALALARTGRVPGLTSMVDASGNVVPAVAQAASLGMPRSRQRRP